MTGKKLVWGLLAVWLAVSVWSVVVTQTTPATGDGFTRGSNRVMLFFLWQGVAALIGAVIWRLGRRFDQRTAGRWLCRVPRSTQCVSGVLLLALAYPVAAQLCESTPDRHAARITAEALTDEQTVLLPEIYGGHSFTQSFGEGWIFELLPGTYGWSIRIYDASDSFSVDLSGITPPHDGVPNPRDIEGWHFRNADNTATNKGEVNAPQLDRLFLFSPALAGTGGYKPSVDETNPESFEPGPDDGLGWLKVIDFGLSDLEPGQKARMTYLKFDACLTWPKQY